MANKSSFDLDFGYGRKGEQLVDELVEDMIVNSAFQNFDSSLQQLLSEETEDEQGGE